MNKKIIVSGCSNCPYLQVGRNGENDGLKSIVVGTCKHPSFNRELISPYFHSSIFFQYQSVDTDGNRVDYSDVHSLRASGTPNWCPLPSDNN